MLQQCRKGNNLLSSSMETTLGVSVHSEPHNCVICNVVLTRLETKVVLVFKILFASIPECRKAHTTRILNEHL